MRTPRHRAREFALQAIYQTILNPSLTAKEVLETIENSDPYVKALENSKKIIVNVELFNALVNGVTENYAVIDKIIKDQLSEKVREIFPVEKSILCVAVYELMEMPKTPYAVIINEAVELSKAYGSPEGHKLVNGMLDNIAIRLRPEEVKEAKLKRAAKQQ